MNCLRFADHPCSLDRSPCLGRSTPNDVGRIAALFAVVYLSAVGCSAGPTDRTEKVAVTEQALEVTLPHMLTRKEGSTLANLANEAQRQANTDLYYRRQFINPNDTSPTSLRINPFLSTLTDFTQYYGFSASTEKVAYYYNRGDLGIGREMHCVDYMQTIYVVACYVRNFAAGDDNTEFTFGQDSAIAFTNMNANHPFATVAMVYDMYAPNSPKNLVFFAVYAANGNLQNFAALDRTGILFASGQNTAAVPGVNFNNHIPSNCATCHGGKPYDYTNTVQAASLFLPFDLDSFEYQNAPGKTRADQLTTFKHLNEMVWKVAVTSGFDTSHSVQKQLDTWYHNTSKQSDNKKEVFENNFDSSAVPTGWSSFSSVYSSVVRPNCRNCHITNSLPFDTESQFRGLAPVIAGDLCGYQMPHSLQALREFWLSSRPAALKGYWRSVGQGAAADQLDACGPGNVATLDPQFVMATSPLLD